MSNIHIFPALHKPDFDTNHFNTLHAKRNYLDHQCYLFLFKILEDLQDQHYSAALALVNKRGLASDELINYLIKGEK